MYKRQGYLLLRGVRLFEAMLEAPLDSSGQALLVYRIYPLSSECVEGLVFLEETEIIRKNHEKKYAYKTPASP